MSFERLCTFNLRPVSRIVFLEKLLSGFKNRFALNVFYVVETRK